MAYPQVRLDPVVGGAIAEAYMAAPRRDERAFAAYAALALSVGIAVNRRADV